MDRRNGYMCESLIDCWYIFALLYWRQPPVRPCTWRPVRAIEKYIKIFSVGRAIPVDVAKVDPGAAPRLAMPPLRTATGTLRPCWNSGGVRKHRHRMRFHRG